MARRRHSFRWKVLPSVAIGGQLRSRLSRLRPALHILAATHAARGEAGMKARAEWTDRTTYARGSLFGRADGMNITLGTANEEYGIFLELGTSRMRAFPTVRPQLQETGEAYFRDAARLTGQTMFGGA